MRTISGEGKKAKEKHFKDHWKGLKAEKKMTEVDQRVESDEV